MSFLKQIKDITITNGDWSIIRTDLLTLEGLVQQIQNLPYTGKGLVKDEVIENTRFPPFLQVFYYLVFQLRRIPNETLFFEEYLKWLAPTALTETTFTYNEQVYSRSGLQARALRTYPSLIRDLHFYYFLLASGEFESVDFSMCTDYYKGLDILVTKNEVSYAVSILIDTDRGAAFKEIKEGRHDYRHVTEIKLAVGFNELVKKGNIYLLGEKQLAYLLEEIKRIAVGR